MATTSASSLPAGYIKIGEQEFGDDVDARCVVVVTVKGKRKLDKKAVDGKSDGTTTDKGREPADIEIEFSWNGANDAIDAAMEEGLYQIAPRGPNGGKPQQVAFKRSRVHGVDSVIVEELDGPHDKPGNDLVTAKLKCASWSKPSQAGQGAATTPTDPKKWADTSGGGTVHVDANGKVQPGPASPAGTAHVDANGKVQPGPAPTAPQVKP